MRVKLKSREALKKLRYFLRLPKIHNLVNSRYSIVCRVQFEILGKLYKMEFEKFKQENVDVSVYVKNPTVLILEC